MSTFGEVVSEIEDDLNRTDLTTQVKREINRAIRKYCKIPFWFTSTSLNFSTAINQQTYDTNDGLPSDIRTINYVRLNQTSATINAETGVADAYVVTPSPAESSYTDNLAVVFKATNANTGASTVNVNGLGVTNIVRPNGVALVSGDIQANQIVTVIYNSDNSNFQLRDNGTSYYPLDKVNIDNILLWNVNENTGLPVNYSWYENKMFFYPNPDQIYPVKIYYDKYYADLSADADTNDFTTNPEAEQLILAEVCYKLYLRVIKDKEKAADYAVLRQEALSTLRTITTSFNGVDGEIRPTLY